ncbi:MAG: hypothetical protein H7836_09530 [Magnetococcus sp. YQC-3]
MKRMIMVAIFLSLLTIMAHQGGAGDHDPKPEFRSNFMYGSNDSLSPDSRKMMQWLHERGEQAKDLTKRVIGVKRYNDIAEMVDRSNRAVQRFIAQVRADKRFEWKATRN